MKLRATFLLAALVFISSQAFSQDVVGEWKTIDDETGKAKSHVRIYKNKSGVLFGRVVKILDPKKRDATCSKCPEEYNGFGKKGQKVLGMLILKGLKKDGDEYNGGYIFDPNKGKSYKCYITLKSKDKLKVRGFIGTRYVGRTQYWYRLK